MTFIVHPETAEQEHALKSLIDKLKIKFEVVTEVENEIDIPEWQKQEVRERISEYQKNPGQTRDFGEAMDDIENDL
jgi:hypothetical protein